MFTGIFLGFLLIIQPLQTRGTASEYNGYHKPTYESVLSKDLPAEKAYYHIAVMGDPHLPGNNIDLKYKVVETFNQWDDIDEIAIVGDLCERTGTAAEFEVAKDFVSRIRKPLELINGNHDYVFEDYDPETQHYTLSQFEDRKRKLNRFRNAFGALSHRKIVTVKSQGQSYPYHLIYLGIDSLTSEYYACLSKRTLWWFNNALKRYPQIPTIVFCHSPLWGRAVLAMNEDLAHVTTQPIDELRRIVKENKQLFLWVAGHAHIGVNHSLATGFLNTFCGQVYTVNNCDINGLSILSGVGVNLEYHSNIWTKSLILYPERIEIKVYDHNSETYIDSKDQQIKVKRGKEGPTFEDVNLFIDSE